MRPVFRLLSDELTERIVAEARSILCTLGVEIHNDGIDNQAAYPLSKQLLIVWTAGSYPVWKQTGVRMNAVAPAAVATPILNDFLLAFGEESAERMRAVGTASAGDVAKVVAMLLDSDYQWINAATIPAERGAIIYGGISKMGLG